MIISRATIIGSAADCAVEEQSIWIENGRIKAVGNLDDFGVSASAASIDARGKYVIPGLMNANVHLLMDIRLETLARYIGRYEELIAEAAQTALKNGLTTVFDTYGPRRFLMSVRDKINAGKIPGCRIFCGGNIIGFDGPFSQDFEFFSKGLGAVSPSFARRINATWVENVGRHLMWLTPEQVAEEVRAYICKGIDFVKYASNDHVPGPFLAFSERVQAAIVEEAHRAGITAQAHTTSVEGLRIAVEAGCNLVQHANHTGPTPIPEATLRLLSRRSTGAVVFPCTQRRLDWFMNNEIFAGHRGATEWKTTDVNVRNLIDAGAALLIGNDGAIMSQETLADPKYASVLGEEIEKENLFMLDTGHFYWLRAMEEKGCAPMELLRAATINIAKAYGKDKDLGTIEPGKIADLIILDKDPLQAAENYRSIHSVIKDGKVVDRGALPVRPILTGPLEPPWEEESSYVTFLSCSKFPGFGCC
jgi:imidazolonepropionase-like amidohydrolase